MVDMTWIADKPPVIGRMKEDKLDDRWMARRRIGECFSVAPPEPPYDQDGIFRRSLVGIGQAGEYWYFRKDPGYVMAVPFGALANLGLAAVDYMKSRMAWLRDSGLA